MVLPEGDDLRVVPEAFAQSQLGDRLHGQTQQVGAQRGMLAIRDRLPLPNQLVHHLRKRGHFHGLVRFLRHFTVFAF